jgi:hypothetical protein
MKKNDIVSEVIEKKAGKEIRVKKNLGFINGKRSFFEGGRNILLIEGGTVSREDYELFNDGAKEVLFDVI